MIGRRLLHYEVVAELGEGGIGRLTDGERPLSISG